MEENQNENKQSTDPTHQNDEPLKPVSGMYEDWFLEYASYVILDRAVPYIEDGLKPVQRRILHAMKEMDDGRFNKVANIIGQTMQYHPHGDAAIGDALVNLGQKELLIETQGNWGNVFTGDSPAAPRYIEARLSQFAKEVVFNPKTTEWKIAYDGRKKEPERLPVKFPLLLAQGVEGIAVGLSTRILPHNFNELLDACIKYLQGKSFELYPDFLTGSMIDISQYNAGKRGGRLRIRSTIRQEDKKTLKISDLPHGVTTSGMIDSILKANDKGKLKIRRIDDNTSKEVEILVHLPQGASPDQTINALYAFTDCEISVSPNCCVIIEDKPCFITIDEALQYSADHTVKLLRTELEIEKKELEEKWHFASLEKIFIEKRIYRQIEESETWEDVLQTIRSGLEPHIKHLKRAITEEDIIRLTEIRIKRISKFDSYKADEHLKQIEDQLEEVKINLSDLTTYAIDYFKMLKKKFGKGHERRTQIRKFDDIEASAAAVANEKLYVDRKSGFIGTGLKKSESEFIGECSDIDDVIVFLKDGTLVVSRVAPKTFIGKNILYVDVYNRQDERRVYHMIYRTSKYGRAMVKRFQVQAFTRDKKYKLAKGDDPEVLYFNVMPNGERESVRVTLRPKMRMRKLNFDFDFGTLDIKSRNAAGNQLCKQEVKKIEHLETGKSTLGGIDIWFEEATLRLNREERGKYLGQFDTGDRIIAFYDDGSYELTDYELTNRYDVHGKLIFIAKLYPQSVVSAIYRDGSSGKIFGKRFKVETTSLNRKNLFITDHKKSELLWATTLLEPWLKVKTAKDNIEVDFEEKVELTGWKAKGTKLNLEVREVEVLEGYEPKDSKAKESSDSENPPPNTDETPSLFS